jgi:hypothetical protein
MKFLLIYPPPEPFFIKDTRVFYGLSPPLGLLYIAKMLENDGDTVTILDFSAEPFDERKLITRLDLVDAVGMTVLSSSLNDVKSLIGLIKYHTARRYLGRNTNGYLCTRRWRSGYYRHQASTQYEKRFFKDTGDCVPNNQWY